MTAALTASRTAPPLPSSGSALPPTPLPGTPLPPSGPVDGSGTAAPNLRYRIIRWMEGHLGRAALPVAAIGGGIVGGTLGALTLGPIGGLAGGVAGAFFGGALFLSD